MQVQQLFCSWQRPKGRIFFEKCPLDSQAWSGSSGTISTGNSGQRNSISAGNAPQGGAAPIDGPKGHNRRSPRFPPPHAHEDYTWFDCALIRTRVANCPYKTGKAGRPQGFRQRSFFRKRPPAKALPAMCGKTGPFSNVFDTWSLCRMVLRQQTTSRQKGKPSLYPHSPGNDGNGSTAESGPLGRGAKAVFGWACAAGNGKRKTSQRGSRTRCAARRTLPVLPARRSEQGANKRRLEKHRQTWERALPSGRIAPARHRTPDAKVWVSLNEGKNKQKRPGRKWPWPRCPAAGRGCPARLKSQAGHCGQTNREKGQNLPMAARQPARLPLPG